MLAENYWARRDDIHRETRGSTPAGIEDREQFLVERMTHQNKGQQNASSTIEISIAGNERAKVGLRQALALKSPGRVTRIPPRRILISI
jgi:hypothetical protein